MWGGGQGWARQGEGGEEGGRGGKRGENKTRLMDRWVIFGLMGRKNAGGKKKCDAFCLRSVNSGND